MFNAFGSRFQETISVVDPIPTVYDSAPAQSPTADFIIIREPTGTQFHETSETPGAPDNCGELPKLLFTVSHLKDKIIINSMAIDSKDAPVINIYSNGLTITSSTGVSLKKYKSKSRVTGTTYKFLCTFIRSLFLPCAFIMVLGFPEVYPAMVDWFNEQTDVFAFFGTGVQHAASSKLAAAILQYLTWSPAALASSSRICAVLLLAIRPTTLSIETLAISHQVYSVLVQSRMFKDIMLCSLFPFSLVGVTGLVKGLITSNDLKQVGNEIVLGIKEQYEILSTSSLDVMYGAMQVAGDCQSAFAAHYNPSAWMVLLGFLIGFTCAWVLFIVLLAVVAAKPTNQPRVLKRA
ncbi:hypothetical protein K435DRAFT_853629 [Dendrothele bispora CBS 962.96]|uniref:Uncharacterized protein n=1 Tax=Dendrothele bispora (strain CBS 962.96) TaxID=1314807 RepID=A0A4S8MGJ8_DENBC|nr:hypothetical protein K435DRAFT_853629 [Dendrothele bispora CBS 962.96]